MRGVRCRDDRRSQLKKYPKVLKRVNAWTFTDYLDTPKYTLDARLGLISGGFVLAKNV